MTSPVRTPRAAVRRLSTYQAEAFLTLLLLVFLLVTSPGSAQAVTQFPGSTPVGQASGSISVTVPFSTAGTPSSVKVLTRGVAGLDFQDAGDNCLAVGSVSPGQTCTANITFQPTTPGERQGAVIVLDGGNHVLGSQSLAGLGAGGLGIFVPGGISTFAGNSASFLFSGDGGPATKASLFLPFGIVFDGAGNLYIADTYNSLVRRVDATTGVIRTVAGNGNSGYSGDGGPATSASLNHPSSIQLDTLGNLYIADTGNNAIRVFDTLTGTISTAVGTGIGGHTGDGGPANLATLQNPNGIAFDLNNNLYIADTGNNVVRVVTPAGVITTVAGNGTGAYKGDGAAATRASLNAPWGVAISGAGELYIADQGNNTIRKVSTAGIISTIAGVARAGFAGDGGLASANATRLSSPSFVLFDAAGNLYIADSGNNRVRKIGATSGIINTIAGGHSDGDGNPANLASLSGPYTLTLDKTGSLYIADALHNRVRKISSNQAFLNFDPQRVNSQSAPQTEILENDGTAPFTVASVQAVTNAILSPASTCTSGATLASIAQCSIVAQFFPTTVGNPATGTITLDSNATNANHTLTLQGVVQNTFSSNVLLNASPNPSIVAQPVTFSVQVVSSGGVVPTGSVTLLDGTTTLGTQQLVNGVASFSISTLSLGAHSITASYAGDVNNDQATSSEVTQVVQAAPVNASTTTTLISSANPSNFGSLLTLTATVASASGNTTVPTGSITFLDGKTPLGTATLTGGTATLSLATLAVGTHQLTAMYGGSGVSLVSTSAVLPEVITAGSATTDFTFTVTPSTLSLKSGTRATLQINISPSASFSGTLLLGCSGLPSNATCTFAADQVPVTAGAQKAVSFVLDTGNPLGSGGSAHLRRDPALRSGIALCMLPASLLLTVLLGKRRRRLLHLRLGAFLVLLGALGAISGCGSGLHITPTPAGTYDFQVVASSSTATSTYALPVHLTVTK